MSDGTLPDMGALFAQAQEMQRRLLEAQERIAKTEVSGSSGGGLVTVRVSGEGELLAVSIDPRVLTNAAPPEAAEAIADLVLAAVRNGNEEANRLRDEAMTPLAAEFGLGGAGGGLPSLGSAGGGMPGLPGL